MTPDELETLWRALPTPAAEGLLEARPLPGDGGLWAARDRDGHPHVLVEVLTGVEAPPVSTHGMRVTVAAHQVSGRQPAQFIDLACLDAVAAPTFAAVAAEIGTAAGQVDPAGRPAVVADALARWQWFWDVDPDRLGEHDALGLFGELWFLLRWVGVTAGAVSAWTASDAARHDLQWPAVSVEVKTTAARPAGGAVHRIVSLDQLADPETGELLLFSLRVVRDQLAANTLPLLVDQIASALPVTARRDFEQKLSRRGYSPAHRRRYETPYRIAEEHLYRVGAGFPRLTLADFGGDLPGGVTDVTYMLATAACADWLVARSADGWTSPER